MLFRVLHVTPHAHSSAEKGMPEVAIAHASWLALLNAFSQAPAYSAVSSQWANGRLNEGDIGGFTCLLLSHSLDNTTHMHTCTHTHARTHAHTMKLVSPPKPHLSTMHHAAMKFSCEWVPATLARHPNMYMSFLLPRIVIHSHIHQSSHISSPPSCPAQTPCPHIYKLSCLVIVGL